MEKWLTQRRSIQHLKFGSVGSDHRIVSARMRLSLRKSKTPSGKNHDWKLLSTDSDLQKQQTTEVRNRFQSLDKLDETATERYDRFIKANKEAAQKITPIRRRTHKANISNDPRETVAKENINKAYVVYQKETLDENRLKHKATKENLEEAYNLVEEEMLASKLKKVENAHANCKHGLSWELINNISGRKVPMRGQLKGDTQQEHVRNWYDHFFPFKRNF